MEARIAVFIPSYPNLDKNNFTHDIHRKKEFNELKMDAVEDVPSEQGKPLLSQNLQSRFITPLTQYDSCLMVHGTGTGKTCVSSIIAENFNDKMEPQLKPKILVLVPNDNLIENYVAEVAQRCTAVGTYDISTQKSMKKSVKNVYTIMKYKDFTNKLKSFNPTFFDNSLIIIDEVHNLKKNNKKSKTGKTTQTSKKYTAIHNFLHNIRSSKVVLLSGTPMYDNEAEIADIMNLILPLNKQMPVGKDFTKKFFRKDADGNLKLKNEGELAEFFKGRVSYLRSMQSTAKRIEYGVLDPFTKDTIVYPSVMGSMQSKAVSKSGEGAINEAIRYVPRNNSTFAVQGGKVNEVFEPQSGKTFPAYTKKYAHLKNIKTLEQLKPYSSKLVEILKWLDKHPNETAFIYDPFVNDLGGVLNIATILKQFGWTWKRTPKEMNSTVQNSFAVFSSSVSAISSGKAIASTLKTFNDPKNKEGKYLRLIIGSRTVSEGLTMKNVRQLHITSGHWNTPLIDQVMGRIFRVGSHDAHSPENRYVRIFRHVAVDKGTTKLNITEGRGGKILKTIIASSTPTVDIDVYATAEDKEFRQTQIIRILKESAWDCSLTYRRNVLEGDVDHTRDCNFEKCNYECRWFANQDIDKSEKVWDYTIPKYQIDYRTYDVYPYSDEAVRAIQQTVMESFRDEIDYIPVNYFVNLLSNQHNKFLILKAIIDIISNGVPIKTNRGITKYLKESMDMLYIDTSRSDKTFAIDSYYNRYQKMMYAPSLKDVVYTSNADKDLRLIELACENRDVKYLNDVSYGTMITLIEEAYLKTSDENPLTNLIKSEYAKSIYKTTRGWLLHTLHNNKARQFAFNMSVQGITSKLTGNVRVLKPDDDKWDYLSPEEEAVVSTEISTKPREEEMIRGDIIGVIKTYPDKRIFAIKHKETAKGKSSRGRNCSTIKKADLYKIIADNNIFIWNAAQEDIDLYKSWDKSRMKDAVKRQPEFSAFVEYIDSYSKEQMIKLFTLHRFSGDELCKMLEDWFLETENIF